MTFARGFRRALGLAAVGLLAFAAVATASGSSHPPLTRSSAFTTGSEGWVGNDGQNMFSATWQSNGGNPGGYVSADFSQGFGDVESSPTAAGTTWKTGDALGDYGGTVSADVRVLLDGSDTDGLLIGFASDNTDFDVCDDVGAPTTSWATYTLTLDTSHLIECLSGDPLTPAEARAELAGFYGMFVLAKDADGVGLTIDVDNAKLSASNDAQMPPTGSVTRTLSVKVKGRTIQGTLTASEDYSCSGKTKVTIVKSGRKPFKVGTATTGAPDHTNDFGAAAFSFKLKKGSKGKYYATVTKTTSKLDGNSCVAAWSKTVKVR